MPTISNTDPCACAGGMSSSWSGATYNVYATCTETTTETSTVNQTVNTRYVDAVDVNAEKVSCTDLIVNGNSIGDVFQNVTATSGQTNITGNLDVSGDLSVLGTASLSQPSLIDPYVSGDLYVDENTTVNSNLVVNGSTSLGSVTLDTATTTGNVAINGNITVASSKYIEFANQTIRYPLNNGLYTYSTSVASTISLTSILNTTPSRITISYYKIKTTGTTGIPCLRINSATSGYKNRNFGYNAQASATATYTSTAGMPLGLVAPGTGSNTWEHSGTIVLTKISSTVWTIVLEGIRVVGTSTNYDTYQGTGLYEGSAIATLALSTTNTDTFQTGGTITVSLE